MLSSIWLTLEGPSIIFYNIYKFQWDTHCSCTDCSLILRCQLYMFRTITVHPQELLFRFCMCRLWYVLQHRVGDVWVISRILWNEVVTYVCCVCLLSWLKYFMVKTVDKIVEHLNCENRCNKLKHISRIKLVDINWIKSLSGNSVVKIHT